MLFSGEKKMPIRINIFKVVNFYIKERLKHPFSFKKRLFEFSEPNVVYGLSDHPLDQHGEAIQDPYTFLKKFFGKKAYCIRETVYRGRMQNTFNFNCSGYNIFVNRLMPKELEDQYPLPKLGRKAKRLTLRIQFLTPKIYRVICVLGEEVPEHNTEMLEKNIENTSNIVEFEETPNHYFLKTAYITLKIYRNNFKIKVLDKEGKLVTESSGRTKNDFVLATDSYPLGFVKVKKKNKWYGVESFVLYPGEAVYGLGEQFSSLNKVGQTISLWNYEGVGNSTGRVYKNIPFFMSTRGYGVFVNESKPITFWVGTKELSKNQMAIEGKLIDYFFFYGPSFKEILYDYTDLTGRSPVPPKWSFGAWIGKLSKFTQLQVMADAKRFREEKFPMDVIHIDTDWFTNDWECDWKFSPVKFPNPRKMFDELKEMGFRVSLWQTPYIMKRVELYKEAKKLGFAAKNHGAFMFLFNPAIAIDFSNLEAVKWYQEKLRNLFELGASAIKTDFGEQIEPHQEFLRYNGKEMHNLFPVLYQKAAFEVTKEFYGKGIIWARSAYIESQRYPVHWSGDSSSRFEELINVLRGGLSLGLCGFTYWSHDVGGFIFSPTDKLYTRWTQLSVFNSHIRFHGCDPKFREPWNYNEEAQRITREFLNLRYRLIPYIYTEAHICSEDGTPMMAPLFLEFQGDYNTYHIEDEFMFGRNLLVAPILTKEDGRRIYLPEGDWYDFWTFERIEGPCWINIECPIEKTPVFLRGGTILPLGPIMQHTDEKPLDSLDILILPGSETYITYKIIDDNQEIEIEAEFIDSNVEIKVPDIIKNVRVEIPSVFDIQDILLNGKILTKLTEGNKITSKNP